MSDQEIPTITGDDLPEFQLAGDLPTGMTVLEASAGTGKTYALTAMVARFIAEQGITTDQVLMVTFTRAAASEMKDRVRQRLFELAAHLSGAHLEDDPWITAVAACGDEERKQRLHRVRQAISTIDSAAITTIHGFCQQTIREMGVSGGDLAVGEVREGDSTVVERQLRDRLLAILANDPDHFGDFKDVGLPTAIEKSMREILKLTASNAGSKVAPLTKSDSPVADNWAAFIRDLSLRIERARIESGQLSFDDLISGMARAASQRSVITRVRQQYRVVLIDEFQDTDVSQWDIFKQLFLDDPKLGESPTVVCVGDPKQAIYRFRGADISAYLAAINRPGAVKYKMATNWRTDRPLVEAMNTLLHSLSLGGDAIRYVQVDAASEHPDSALSNGGKPLQIRWVADGGKPYTADEARPAIATDVVNHIVTLLTKGTLHKGEAEVAVKPGDIAVLVRSHGDAEPIIEALRLRGIPAVRSRLGSVTETEAMSQLQVLAAAIADPSNAAVVRALALTWFVDVAHSDVLLDPIVEGLQARCAAWGATLQRGGAAALLASLRTDPDVLSALARAELERRLTDIEHLLELVQSETKGAPMHPSHLSRVLRSLLDEVGDPEVRTRRTDTDADSVQITTMHSSKGLEYPIVLIPFPKAPNVRTPYVYSALGPGGSMVRYVDAAPKIEWTADGISFAERKDRTSSEVADDELRLMYVALTRAKHQVIMWWANTRGAGSGATAHVLFRQGDGSVVAPKGDGATAAHFAALAEKVGTNLGVHEITTTVTPSSTELPQIRIADDLTVAHFDREHVQRPSWYRWSFSSMMRSDAAPTPVREVGGVDETEAERVEQQTTGQPVQARLLAMPASNHFGTLVHELFEAVDFASASLDDDLAALIAADERVTALGADPELLRAGLLDVIRTPLHGLFDNAALIDIGAADRLAEMEFHFPIRDTDAALRNATIAEIAAQHTVGAVHDYFAQLATSWTDERIRGLMTGSIDAVLRVGGCYAVVDYKSNRVHPRDAEALDGHYSGAGLLEAMASHDYLMQALLYSVALHRFLAERLPGYEPDVHHGGAGYLFIRGMSGADTPVIDGAVRGLCAWRPPTELLVALDRHFAGTEVLA